MPGTASVRKLERQPGCRHSAGRAWRRCPRRRGPAVPRVHPFAVQRVHNVYHHLEDHSLPYDLWNDEAELAAIVHALHCSTLDQALARLPEIVGEYTESNRRIGVHTRPFDRERLKNRIRSVAGVAPCLPIEQPAQVYRDLLAAGAVMFQ